MAQIYFQKVEKKQPPATTIPEPRFHHKLTTKNHRNTTCFRQKFVKPPAKTPLHRNQKKTTGWTPSRRGRDVRSRGQLPGSSRSPSQSPSARSAEDSQGSPAPRARHQPPGRDADRQPSWEWLRQARPVCPSVQ